MIFGISAFTGGYYFIGIGGVSMSSLAAFLVGNGVRVRGSDDCESGFTRKLRGLGIPVRIGRDEEITEENVVYTGAVGEDHPQLIAARRAGKRILPRAELLAEIAKCFPRVISVAGCHGKTTTSSMLSHICLGSGKPFTCHIGGEDIVLGNYHSTGGDYFITEACEFKRSFLSLRGGIAVILNCDLDHTDCYEDGDDLARAYRAFAAQADSVVVNADDRVARDIPHALSFGLYAGDIRAENLRAVGEKYTFTVTEGGLPVVRIKLSVVGKVHVLNALAAFAAARLAGFTAEEIKGGVEEFRGVKRRFEEVGTFMGCPVICDYAHHPREIATTLKTAQRLCEGTVRVVFQPHTYTRTRDLMGSFVEVLKRAERPILYRTYAAREPFDSAGSAVTLAGNLPDAIYVQSREQLKSRLSALAERGDMILVLGAGDIYDIAKEILDKRP